MATSNQQWLPLRTLTPSFHPLFPFFPFLRLRWSFKSGPMSLSVKRSSSSEEGLQWVLLTHKKWNLILVIMYWNIPSSWENNIWSDRTVSTIGTVHQKLGMHCCIHTVKLSLSYIRLPKKNDKKKNGMVIVFDTSNKHLVGHFLEHLPF